MTSLRTAALACAAALAASPALAQYGTTRAEQSTPMQNTQNAGAMQGLHTMPATVTSIDKSTGMVSVKSEGMKLRLHFPPSALTNIKSGDKIKVQLGLTKT